MNVPVTLANPGKAAIIIAGMAAVTLLMALGRITSEAGLPVLTAFVGYGIGNGVAARSGTPSSPIIAPKEGKK
jgi:hypothetical protein